MTEDNGKARLLKLLENLNNANLRLQESLRLEPTQIHKDATIQRFEFTIELSWKTMQSALRFMGEESFSPRDAIRESARIELISDPDKWLTLLTARNLTAHIYQEEVAEEVYMEAKALPVLVDELVKNINGRIA